jgi:hypothetical protein
MNCFACSANQNITFKVDGKPVHPARYVEVVNQHYAEREDKLKAEITQLRRRAEIAEEKIDACWRLIEKLRVYPVFRRKLWCYNHVSEIDEMILPTAIDFIKSFYEIDSGLSLADVDTCKETWLRWAEEAYLEATAEHDAREGRE